MTADTVKTAGPTAPLAPPLRSGDIEMPEDPTVETTARWIQAHSQPLEEG